MSDELEKKFWRLESRIVRLEGELDAASRHIRELERWNQILTSAVVSAFVSAIGCVLILGRELDP